MLNHIWAGMLLAGFVYGIGTGNIHTMSESMLGAAGDAVDLSITLLGAVAFWCGIMEIAQEAGLVEALSNKMRPVIHFLFPAVPAGHKSLEAISMNFIANILGLGWAATPAGLKAMEYLAELEEQRQDKGKYRQSKQANPISTISNGMNSNENQVSKSIASNEICTFLVLNISSLQLIPVNIIAYRSQYGSVNPTAIVGPAIAATTVSTAVAVVFCKIMGRRRKI